MKFIYYKSKKYINFFVNFELRYIFYKSCFFNLKFSNNLRKYFYTKLIKRKKKYFFSFFKARCFFDSNSRHLLDLFKLSRYRFKFLASHGYLNGIKKV